MTDRRDSRVREHTDSSKLSFQEDLESYLEKYALPEEDISSLKEEFLYEYFERVEKIPDDLKEKIRSFLDEYTEKFKKGFITDVNDDFYYSDLYREHFINFVECVKMEIERIPNDFPHIPDHVIIKINAATEKILKFYVRKARLPCPCSINIGFPSCFDEDLAAIFSIIILIILIILILVGLFSGTLLIMLGITASVFSVILLACKIVPILIKNRRMKFIETLHILNHS